MLNDMTPEQLELAALATLLQPVDIRYAVGQGVDEYSFQVDEYVRVWEYLVARSSTADTITYEDVLTICGVSLPEGLTDRDTLVNALVNMSMYRRASESAVRQLGTVNDNPTDGSREMVSALVAELSALNAQAKGAHVGHYIGDARKRLEEVKARRDIVEAGGMVGLHTGLKVFDNANDGWQAGDLVAVIGALNIGKSFFILWSAAHAWYYDNAKVLFISPESMQFDVFARLDAIVAHFEEKDLSNKAIRRGTIDFIDYEAHIDRLEKRGAEGKNDFIVIDNADTSGFTDQDIISLAREHRPDLLVIDGFHLVRIAGKGGDGGKSWEKIKAAADAIKVAAQALNMAVIAGSQATRGAVMAPGDAPELGESAYGMGLVEAANRVIALASRQGNKQSRVFKIQKNRDDEVPGESFYLRFNVDVGDIAQIEASTGSDALITWTES